ncbi:MAG: SDR family oxidoreductase [Rhodospirillales bacterium]|nr:SDR family oxidoreductase [Acetobacter sp.]
MVLLTGATGHNGAETARQLVRLGAKVRAMAIHPEKACTQVPAGVKVVPGDLDRPESFAAALTGGVETVFLLSPADERLARRESGFVAAAKAASVRRIVKFSVLDAGEDAPFSFGRWHGVAERAVVESGLAYTFLRPTVFMQNLLWSAASIKAEGRFALPLAHARMGLVDTRDVAAVAARVLVENDGRHDRHAYPLTGPASLTYDEVAATTSEVLGRTVLYIPSTPEERRRELAAQGMPESYIAAELDLAEAMIAGAGDQVSPSVEEVTGQPARSVATFARDYLSAFA